MADGVVYKSAYTGAQIDEAIGKALSGGSSASVGDGAYEFSINENGELILAYQGDTPPNYSINETGHLILTVDDGHTIDLGLVKGPKGDQGDAGVGAILKITFAGDFAGQTYTVTGGSENYTGTVPEDLIVRVTVMPEGLTAYTINCNGSEVTQDIQYFGVYPVTVEAPPAIEIVPWSTGTDEQIAAMLDAAKAGMIDLQTDGGWQVGDVRTIQIAAFTGGGSTAHAAQSIDIVISSFEDYNNSGSVMQFDFKDELATAVRMNSSNTNAGGYKATEMYKTTPPALVNALPEWLKSRLLEFSVLASAGNQSSTIETVTGNKLALRSEVEIFGKTSYSKAGEGTQIEYYKTAANRIKKRGHNGSAYGWWERSPIGSGTQGFCIVGSDGSASISGASIAYGVAPFGCI